MYLAQQIKHKNKAPVGALFSCEADERECCDSKETANEYKPSADISSLNHIDIFDIEVVKDQILEEPQLFISAKYVTHKKSS